MAERIAVRLVVSGRVQGVGFRAFVQRAATSAGVGGWCRNRWDETVEVQLSGAPDRVEQVIEACRVGPRWAAVDAVEVERGVGDPLVSSFTIRD